MKTRLRFNGEEWEFVQEPDWLAFQTEMVLAAIFNRKLPVVIEEIS